MPFDKRLEGGDYHRKTAIFTAVFVLEKALFANLSTVKLPVSIFDRLTRLVYNPNQEGGATGAYRVSSIQVYDRESGTYQNLDLEKNYTVAGINYLLRNCGSGYSMFQDSELVIDYVGEDYLISAYYLDAFKEDDDKWPHICTANSPLADWTGYDLDYENPYGAGRITVN